MRGHNKKLTACTVLMMILMMVVPVFAGQVTLTGQVTEGFQIVDDQGQAYEIAEGAMGDEIMEKASGKTVEVTGTLEEDGDVKTIVVKSYKILEE